ELLFWAARQPDGDRKWRDIAIRHARTTAAHHIRADGGSFHVVVFDPADGRVIERSTHQGHADSTTWARGQAWLIYGFTMAYRETGEPEFLTTAQRVADYFVAHLPQDGVPCWDFQAPGCPATAKRDASAAAIAASGMLELGGKYRATAQRILATLASPEYLADSGDALLKHAVGHHPRGTEVDVGIAYADYYFVEALTRLASLPAYTPRTFTYRGELMRGARDRIARNDTRLRDAYAKLLGEADSALTVGPFTVTSKERTPPSGSKNDYVSYAPYWWPDSTKPNGLPYIRRDGVVNQALRRDSDVLRWYALVDAVETLGHAYYFSGKEAYAEGAASLLRTWFIDPRTRMNPHLNYGQAIPGVTEGRGIGIIDTRDLGRMLDAVTLIDASASWPPEDRAKLREWMSAYRTWLRTSPHGIDEADEANNHGTWYDAQVVALSLFLGDTATARDVLERSTKARIAAQIDTAGRQPLELARTRSLHYSVENLEGFTRLADMARHVGVDLWPSLRRAIDYVAPYADPQKQWPGQQITAEAPDLFVPLLRRARIAYDEADYREALKPLAARMLREHRTTLLYPEPPRVGADSLLGGSRIAMLPSAERAMWERYIATSTANQARDRAVFGAGMTLTNAPAGQGFSVSREMTPAYFASREARRLGDFLLSYQTPTGGWSKRIEYTRLRGPAESFASEGNWTWIATLDNGATTEQIKFLALLHGVQKEAAYGNAVARGVRYLLAAQMPNGCWPQSYPLAGSYHDAITFNDDATINALEIFERVVATNSEYAVLPASVRDSARAGLQHGVECILRTQVSTNGYKSVWGAQHDPLTWQPVKARAYEHASLSGRESAAILDFLMRIQNPGDSVQAAIHAAADWFKANAIRGYSYVPRGELTPDPNGGPLWARFYEVGTNRPIFSDRDGVVRYKLSEVGEERRRGYLWYTDEPISTLRRYDAWAPKHPKAN
ncbi:MAG TPA: pectate lyase, partial [Longimicrobiales bacterium]